uniref:Ovule protein n=1 Tax=Meloidogyne incognita TaxID=6306 RepID=A0A914KUY7_MELIC
MKKVLNLKRKPYLNSSIVILLYFHFEPLECLLFHQIFVEKIDRVFEGFRKIRSLKIICHIHRSV